MFIINEKKIISLVSKSIVTRVRIHLIIDVPDVI